jgi:hypothetical protein
MPNITPNTPPPVSVGEWITPKSGYGETWRRLDGMLRIVQYGWTDLKDEVAGIAVVGQQLPGRPYRLVRHNRGD